MSEHLPECPVVQFYKPTGVCICDRLRACEQRKNQEWLDRLRRQDQFAAGVQAARDTVAGIPQYGLPEYAFRDNALAAIDGINSEEVDEDIALASEGGRIINEWVKGLRDE